MARQHAVSQRFMPIVKAALAAFGLVILFGKQDGPAGWLMTDLLGAAARIALDVSLSLVPAAFQVLQAFAFDHLSLPCPLEMLASLWPLLHVITGAA
jgi:hypothetical protein